MSEAHVHLREWQTRGPQDAHAGLRGLRLDGEDARTVARQLTDSRALEITELYDGIRIAARAHVGRIQLGSLVITIEPKIGGPQLLDLLRYTHGLRNLQLFDVASFATTGQLLQDLLCAQLNAEVSELARRGLCRRYMPQSAMLASPRGRLDMTDLARRSPLRAARMTCRYHERRTDHLLNRVIRAGLERAAKVAQDPRLRISLSGLARHLGEEVGGLSLNPANLDQARRQLDRLTAAYGPALRLTELLYACSAIAFDGEPTTSLRGFLFDMNRFFQALLERFLQENLAGFEIQAEQGLTEMMRYTPGVNPRGRRSPRPRPDFQVCKRGAVTALLDAKYRDLWERDLPREMLYQLAIYALSQPRGATAAILFPTQAPDAREALIEIRDPVRHCAIGYVALRPVILGELTAVLQDRGRPVCRQELAAKLALGPLPSAPASETQVRRLAAKID